MAIAKIQNINKIYTKDLETNNIRLPGDWHRNKIVIYYTNI